MCGIVGYVGESKALPRLLDGLEKLEYRGYDSAGIAYIENDQLLVKKAVGKLDNLRQVVDDEGTSVIGIGHTRWATHGVPSEVNAHPHLSMNGRIAVIHNGIIENYRKLKEFLIHEHGITFESETDTEVIAHLVDLYYKEEADLLHAVKRAVDQMEGAYALGIISTYEPDRIVAVRKDSPLIIGQGENQNYMASDVPALIKYTRDVYYIENDQYVVMTESDITIYDALLQEVDLPLSHVDWDVESAEKEGYEHFTLKEIHEQPKGISQTVNRRLSDGEIDIEFSLSKETLEKTDKVIIVACGTAYHAGLMGKYVIEKYTDIPVQVEIASEFRYTKQFVNDKTLFIAVSQSGETIDTLSALRKAKEMGAKVLSILNVVGSSIARESDEVFYTWAGPEIGVASTKAYTTQLASFYLIAIKMAMLLGRMEKARYEELVSSLEKLPELTEETLKTEDQIRDLAYQCFNNESVIFIGRGADYYTALEASLKLKEVSYINSLAIQAGELKHGTIALIEEGSLVVAFVTKEIFADKMLSNIKEVKARGARVLAILSEDCKELSDVAEDAIVLPQMDTDLINILAVIPAQLFAYYVSLARGNDVDKPRNLAKSVTVE